MVRRSAAESFRSIRIPTRYCKLYADLGVNGVWLHRRKAARLWRRRRCIPEFGNGSSRRLENLRKLVAAGEAISGIGVYLYTNEPRSMPAEFFSAITRTTPACNEATAGGNVYFEPARAAMAGGFARIRVQIRPGFGGRLRQSRRRRIWMNCGSRTGIRTSARDGKERSASDVIADVNTVIAEGVHRGNPKATVIVWDWGWKDDQVRSDHRKTPRERRVHVGQRMGVPTDAARGSKIKSRSTPYRRSGRGGGRWIGGSLVAGRVMLECIAKVQVNNSREISAVPYLPVMD